MNAMTGIPFPAISPEIFSIELFGMTLALRWYALAYIVGILAGWWIMRRAVASDRLWGGPAPLSRTDVDDFLTWLVVGVVLGGRLGYVLFYDPLHFAANPLEIIGIQGPGLNFSGLRGLSFHGGFLGVVAAAILFARVRKIRLSALADLLALTATPAIVLVRGANFVNAELWGRPTEMPWGVIFPGPAAQFCEGVAGLCARHPSQLYEALLEGALLGVILLYLAFRRRWLRTPWRLTGLFIAGYGLARMVVELYRLADEQFITPDNPFGHVLRITPEIGLTQGQILSLPMLVIGLVVLIRAGRTRP
jgi:phosphatidylglycerol:prolipoprotein diacylglycerol transferase